MKTVPFFANFQMTKCTGMLVSKAPNDQNNVAVSLQGKQQAGHYWHSNSLKHRWLDAKVAVEKTTELWQSSMASSYFELDSDLCAAKMYYAEALSSVSTLYMVLNNQSVKACMGQKLHLRISNLWKCGGLEPSPECGSFALGARRPLLYLCSAVLIAVGELPR